MTSSTYLSFDMRYDLNIQCVQSLNTGHGQISGLYYEGNRSCTFSMVEGQLHEDQINTIQMYMFVPYYLLFF